MKDEDKTKEQLINELVLLRKHTAQMEEGLTKHKLMEEALRESEERLRAFVDNSPTIAWMKDEHGQCVYLSKSYESRFGVRFEDWRGKTDFELWAQEVAEEFWRHDQAILASGQMMQVIEEIPNPDGARCHWWNFKFPFTGASGKRYVGGVGIDITNRVRAERELRTMSLYARSLIEASLDPLVTISADGKIMDVNEATETVTGISRMHLIGSDFSDYFTEPERARAGYQQVFEEGSVRDYPLAVRHRSGSVTEVLYNATLYKNETGEVEGVVAIARDITARKLAEETLRESLEENKMLLREIHHRVKNNLQTIISLIQMGARSSSHGETIQMLTDLQERVRVMTLVHEKLYRSDHFSEIDFGFYLRELIDHLLLAFGSPEVKLEICADSILLETETVITCGLITCELITNALKYAFPNIHGHRMEGEPPHCQVHIGFAEHEEEFTLEVYDNGIGLPQGLDLSTVGSLGLHLVYLWSTHQLSGSIKVENERGAKFLIRFPKRRQRR